MGSRAGIIIVGGSRVEVYYAHWAARSLAQDAALDGFAGTLRRVRAMQRLEVASLAAWDAASWMEGGMLIDLDQRRVAWAEDGDGLILPRIANRLVEVSWPGWAATWAPEGMRGLIRLAGTDPAPLFARAPVYARRRLVNDAWFEPGAGQCIGDPISVRLDDGPIVLWRTDSRLDDIADFGPGDIIEFAQGARDRGQTGDGWGAHWRLTRPGRPGWAESGIHIDVPQNAVLSWATFEWWRPEREINAHWPGWNWQTLGDDFEWHARELGGIQLSKPWSEHIHDARSWMHRRAAERTGDDGQAADEVMNALADLDAGAPLPPVPYVSSDGLIHIPVSGDV